jgi:hypothetical protein
MAKRCVICYGLLPSNVAVMDRKCEASRFLSIIVHGRGLEEKTYTVTSGRDKIVLVARVLAFAF